MSVFDAFDPKDQTRLDRRLAKLDRQLARVAVHPDAEATEKATKEQA